MPLHYLPLGLTVLAVLALGIIAIISSTSGGAAWLQRQWRGDAAAPRTGYRRVDDSTRASDADGLAAHDRHADGAPHEVGPSGLEDLQRRLPISGLAQAIDVDTGHVQRLADHGPDNGRIVNEQNVERPGPDLL